MFPFLSLEHEPQTASTWLTAEASERRGRGLLGATEEVKEEIKWFVDTFSSRRIVGAKKEMFDIICSDKIDGL